MDNLQVLSAGGKVYARKRRAKKETVDKIEFDFDARKEFLTGFHKRKLERTAKARDLAKAREHQARLEARRESREERKRLAGERVAEMAVLMKQQMGGLSEEEEGETVFDTLEDDMVDDNEPAEPKVTEFKTPSSLTTVTVIEDFELEDTYQSGKAQPRKSREGDEGANADETTNKAAKQYKNTAPTTKSKSTAPKKKFRYESKGKRRLEKKNGKSYDRGGGNTGKKGKRMR